LSARKRVVLTAPTVGKNVRLSEKRVVVLGPVGAGVDGVG
jgi:hypothetical protein